MGYGFIPWLLFYFLLVEPRHHGEKRVQDADNLPVCCSSVSNIQRLWKSIIISAISRGKVVENGVILIFHLHNLWGKHVKAGRNRNVCQKKQFTAGDNTDLSILHGKSHMGMLRHERAAGDVCAVETWITFLLANSCCVQPLSTHSEKGMAYKIGNIGKIR